MPIADLRKTVEKRKPMGSTEDELAERFTGAFQSLLTKAITDIESGRLRVDNFTELQRVYMMWKEVTDYQYLLENQGNGEGTLPALNTRAASVIAKAGLDESTERLEDLDDDGMVNLIAGLMKADNLANVDEMRGQE